jgi:hypothetical protein
MNIPILYYYKLRTLKSQLNIIPKRIILWLEHRARRDKAHHQR